MPSLSFPKYYLTYLVLKDLYGIPETNTLAIVEKKINLVAK
jgi:hypothetical protein